MSTTVARPKPPHRTKGARSAVLLLILSLLLLLPAGSPSAAPRPSAPAAKTLAFLSVPTVQRAGRPWAPLTVAVLSNGAVNTKDNKSKVVLSLPPDYGTLSGTLTRTVVGGIATFNDLAYSEPSNNDLVLTATLSGTPSVWTLSDTIRVRVPALSFDPLPLPPVDAGSPWPAFSVKVSLDGVLESGDNGTVVTLSRNWGTGTLSGTLSKPVTGGIATFTGISYDRPESIILLASSSDPMTTPVSTGFVQVKAPFVFSTTSLSPTGSWVPLNRSIDIRFNAPVIPATVNAQTVAVVRNSTGQPVAGTLALADNNTRVTFDPAGLFGTAAGYTVYVSTGVRCAVDNSGLAQPVQWAFTSRPPGWDGSVEIGYPYAPGTIRLAGTAPLGNGEGLAAWSVLEPAYPASFMEVGRHSGPAGAWITGPSFFLGQSPRESRLKIAAGSPGKAVALWSRSTAPYTFDEPVSAGYDGNLGMPVVIGPGGVSILSTRLASNGSGFAAASWVAVYDNAFSPALTVHANVRQQDGAWTRPGSLSPFARGNSIGDHQVAVGRSGAAAAVWTNRDASDPGPSVNVFSTASLPGQAPWFPAVPIAVADNNARLGLGVSDDDFAFLAHVGNGTLHAYRYPVDSAGGYPFLLHGSGPAVPGSVSLSVHGTEALVAWVTTNVNRYDLWSARNRNGVWEPPVPVDQGYLRMGNPVTAYDGLGNAFIAWTGDAFDNCVIVRASRLPAGSPPGAPAWEEPNPFGLTGYDELSLSADAEGNAFLEYFDGGGIYGPAIRGVFYQGFRP